jgi:hypothetical protein
MRRKWLVLPVAVFALIAGCVGAFAAWAGRPRAVTAEDDDGFVENLPSVRAYVRGSIRGREAAGQWLAVEVAYSTRDNDLARLLALGQEEDGAFRDDEAGALLLCHGLLLEDRSSQLQRVRDLWRGREHKAAEWLSLDADVLLHEDRRAEARELLRSRTFAGKLDAGRLGRLALAQDHPAAARVLIARATSCAPDDPDVRDCSGRLLEVQGRPDAAAVEYAAALAARGGNDWVIRDRLAECYRRAGAVDAAADVWLPGGGVHPADFAWFKAWFWNRVVRPVSRDWGVGAPDVGAARELAARLAAFPPGEFWVEEPQRGHRPPPRVLRRQEVYWLRLLSLLQAGREAEAVYALRTGPFRNVSWQPDLEEALDLVLAFRAGQWLHPRPDARTHGPRHPFFDGLERRAADGTLNPQAPAPGDDVRRLLASDEALSATFLAAGWDEAALLLHRTWADVSKLPAWFADGLVRAMWANRGSRAALHFVLEQPRSATLDFVAGELLAAEGRGPEALERLRAAAASPEDGQRAARLFALEALRQGKPAEARQMLEDKPELTADVAGRALLARCAAVEGNDDRAEQLYCELADESAEARTYLMRRALAGGDWREARRLAGGMLREAGR